MRAASPAPVLCCQHEAAAAVGHLDLLAPDLLAVCLADGTVALLSGKVRLLLLPAISYRTSRTEAAV